LREAGDHSAAGLKAARDELETGVRDGIKTIADTTETASAQLSETVSSLAEVVNGLTACLSRTAIQIEAQQGRLATAGEVVGAASTKLATAAGNVETATTPLSGSIRNINVALDQLSKATEQLNRSSASGEKVAEMLNGSLEKAKSVSETQARQFTDLERAVKQTLNELNDGVLRLGKQISDCIETYDAEIAKSIGSLETAMLDVADIVDQRRPGATISGVRG
jgi:ABC-type transporter Mla subunit MlaD